MLDLDKVRYQDPVQSRKADEAMMALCQFLKDRRKDLPPPKVERVVATLRSLKLRPYWNYCREHMLDIGLEF